MTTHAYDLLRRGGSNFVPRRTIGTSLRGDTPAGKRRRWLRWMRCLPLMLVSTIVMPHIVLAGGPSALTYNEGVTEPYREIQLSAAEPGVMASILVQEGDRVRTGQLLAELDLQALRAALAIAEARAEARGRVDAATADVELRRDRWKKLSELRASGFARETELQRAQAELAIAEAALLTAREEREINRLEIARIEALIERRRLHSPIDGVVTRIYQDEGEYVAPDQSGVLTLVQLDPLRVVFATAGRVAAELTPGQTVPLRILESGRRAKAVVEFISPVNDGQTGTVRVKVLLDNKEGQYRSGVRCRLELAGADGQADAKLSRNRRDARRLPSGTAGGSP